ncbi:MAG: glycosyltransferase family 9 protein [Elusimicrobiota bacterium]
MPNIKKILVIQLRRIGDVVLTTSAVEALRKKFPEAHIDFLVEPASAPVLRGNPNIDQVLVYDKKKSLLWLGKIFWARYDLVIDFLNNPRSALLTFFGFAKIRLGFKYAYKGRSWAYNLKPLPDPKNKYMVDYKFDLLRPLGIERKNEKPLLVVDHKSLRQAKEFFQSFGPHPWVGISPVSRRATRVWKKEYFAKISDYLTEKYKVKVIFFWGPGEEETIAQIFSLLRFPAVKYLPQGLEKLIAFISCCQLFISNDNGPRHLAVALGVPTVGVFGATSAIACTPVEDQHRAIQSPLNCSPCFNNQCPTIECMEQIKPEAVSKIIDELVNKKIVRF